MKRQVLVAVVAVGFALGALLAGRGNSGIADSPWSTEEISSQALAHYAHALQHGGERVQVKGVRLVPTEDPNTFEGSVTFSDHTELPFAVNVDPESGVPAFVEGTRTQPPVATDA